MFVVSSVVLKNNGSCLVGAHRSLVLSLGEGMGGIWLSIFAERQLVASDLVLTSVLLSPRHFFF